MKVGEIIFFNGKESQLGHFIETCVANLDIECYRPLLRRRSAPWLLMTRIVYCILLWVCKYGIISLIFLWHHQFLTNFPVYFCVPSSLFLSGLILVDRRQAVCMDQGGGRPLHTALPHHILPTKVWRAHQIRSFSWNLILSEACRWRESQGKGCLIIITSPTLFDLTCSTHCEQLV